MLSQNRISKFFTKIRGTHTRRISLSRKSVSVILTLILLAAFGGGLYLRGLSQPPQTIAADESELKTAIARQGDLILYASGSGTLIALSETSFGFNTSGQVTQLNIKVGDVVEAGQVLAELDNASATLTYQRAQRTLNEMTSPAAIAIAQDSVATAEYNVATTREDLQYLISPAV
jgi:macrolide-specific efflux system membrane fusion protein